MNAPKKPTWLYFQSIDSAIRNFRAFFKLKKKNKNNNNKQNKQIIEKNHISVKPIQPVA